MSKRCFTAEEHAARALADRCDECLLVRMTEPGPRPVPELIAVHAGPSAFLPSEPGPPVWEGDGRTGLLSSAYARDWDVFLEREPEVPPHPAPEISSRDNVLPVEKKAVLDLQAFAAERGWSSMVQYARGSRPHAKTAAPGPQRDSLAVKLQNGGRFALAVYREGASAWAWDTLYVDGKRCETITQLKELL